MLWPNWGKAYRPHDSPGELTFLAKRNVDPDKYYAELMDQLRSAPDEEPQIASSRNAAQSHFRIAKWINGLPGAAAIVDWLTAHVAGSHHQKMVVVRGSSGIYGLCGGVDINADRVVVIEPGKGQPLHDAHVEVRGPAAHDLVAVFSERWLAHPWARKHEETDRLLGRDIHRTRDVGPGTPGQVVRVATTFNQVDPEDLYKVKRRACKRSRSTRDGLIGEDGFLGAIGDARRFIYFEDQYMTSLAVAEALGAAATHVRYVLALITGGAISDLPQVWRRRKDFIQRAKAKLGDKLHVFYLTDPQHSEETQEGTYVHAKVWIFDDELAYVGSANVNNRGLSSDSEVGIFACDKRATATPPYGFAKDLRMRLWKRHLGFDVVDGYDGLDAWLTAPKDKTARRVRPYNPDAGKDEGASTKLPWEFIDPDSEGLPECGVARALRQLTRKAFGVP
jgi:phosphatidylserine/phosphatidylglycerophosphate/cardiolipin synthase-like enzyme